MIHIDAHPVAIMQVEARRRAISISPIVAIAPPVLMRPRVIINLVVGIVIISVVSGIAGIIRFHGATRNERQQRRRGNGERGFT
jgi:hypothetical protein